jgi:hypothetical protein
MTIRNIANTAVFVLAAGLVVGSAGCTGSDPLTPSSGNLEVQVEVVNTETRFNVAQFSITQVTLRPLDPAASEILGDRDIGALPVALGLDLEETTYTSGTATLADGVYSLENLVLSAVNYNDTDPPVSEDTCEEYISRYRLTAPTIPVAIGEFGRDVTVTINGGQLSVLKFTVDGQGLIAAIQQVWQCGQNCGGSIFPPRPSEPWCLLPLPGGFDSDEFIALSQTFLTIE